MSTTKLGAKTQESNPQIAATNHQIPATQWQLVWLLPSTRERGEPESRVEIPRYTMVPLKSLWWQLLLATPCPVMGAWRHGDSSTEFLATIPGYYRGPISTGTSWRVGKNYAYCSV